MFPNNATLRLPGISYDFAQDGSRNGEPFDGLRADPLGPRVYPGHPRVPLIGPTKGKRFMV